jgi:hypothetical protein
MQVRRGVYVIPVTLKDKLRDLMEKSGVRERKGVVTIKLIYRFSEIKNGLAKELSGSKSKNTALIELQNLVLSESRQFDFEKDYLLVLRRKKARTKE